MNQQQSGMSLGLSANLSLPAGYHLRQTFLSANLFKTQGIFQLVSASTS